ncbi:MAG TPA: hypothetical protein PLC07_10560 [Bacillota bacterium]|nr:hypothetical protein [Bacillota bacterium]HPT87921.1 hypothetical protein [Bacillota bacterium]
MTHSCLILIYNDKKEDIKSEVITDGNSNEAGLVARIAADNGGLRDTPSTEMGSGPLAMP